MSGLVVRLQLIEVDGIALGRCWRLWNLDNQEDLLEDGDWEGVEPIISKLSRDRGKNENIETRSVLEMSIRKIVHSLIQLVYL